MSKLLKAPFLVFLAFDFVRFSNTLPGDSGGGLLWMPPNLFQKYALVDLVIVILLQYHIKRDECGKQKKNINRYGSHFSRREDFIYFDNFHFRGGKEEVHKGEFWTEV